MNSPRAVAWRDSVLDCGSRLPLFLACTGGERRVFFFLVGAVAISALPPLNGFVSEWLTYQALLQGFGTTQSLWRLIFPWSGAVLALTGALAAACFVKAFGITFLAQPRSEHAAHAHEVAPSMRFGMAVLALFGTIFTCAAAIGKAGGETMPNFNWSRLLAMAPQLDHHLITLAFIFVVVGYGTKAGLAPMHTWKPDAYAEAPVPSAALLGAGFINCALYGIMRFHALAAKCLGHDYTGSLLVLFGVASILVAAPFVLVQRNFRRLLAYSSIDHAGIMVTALGFGGKLGALGAALHMLFHAVTKPLMFFCAGNVQQHYGSPYFRKVSGVFHTLPWTGGLFLMATFAVTGVPPFSLFQSEFATLSAAFAAGHAWPAGLFLAGIVTICTDVAFVAAHMHAMRLKECVLRVNEQLTGNRLLRGMACLGGVRFGFDADQLRALTRFVDDLENEFKELVELIRSHSGTLDRLENTGMLKPEVARDRGIVGIAGRASGFEHDLRRDFPHALYDQVQFTVPVFTEGDVQRRMVVRREELFQSFGIIRQVVEKLPAGSTRTKIDEVPSDRMALGYVEGWRGEFSRRVSRD